jgi:formiminoglutamase
MSFKPVAQDLYFSRNDPHDRRLGEIARPCAKIAEAEEGHRSIAILGYPDDEGIQRNGGRPGAAQAPDRIRKFLYRMTPSALSGAETQARLFDLGNLDPAKHDLAKRHEVAQGAAALALAAGHRVLSFGGGHDYGFPDGAAFVADCLRTSGPRPLVLNFDAHLDVRPVNKGLTSGTPFFRLLERYPEIDFAEIGIQAHCNARAHLEEAKLFHQCKSPHHLALCGRYWRKIVE